MMRETKFEMKYIIAITALAFVSGLFGGVYSRYYDDDAPSRNLNHEQGSVVEAIKKVGPAVVTVVASSDLPLYRERIFNFEDSYFRSFSSESGEEWGGASDPSDLSIGSGFLVSEEGLVLTNYHVVDSPDSSFKVILADGTTLSVEGIEADPTRDLALLSTLNEAGELPKDLPQVELGDSGALEVGEPVIVMGTSPGPYSNMVTMGIVSGLNRAIAPDDIEGDGLINLIQTDALIQPGNSGGPLFTLHGKVVGITTAASSSNGAIGFAIPSTDFEDFVVNAMQN